MKEEDRCDKCGCFMRFVDNSRMTAFGWCEDDGYVCTNCERKTKSTTK